MERISFSNSLKFPDKTVPPEIVPTKRDPQNKTSSIEARRVRAKKRKKDEEEDPSNILDRISPPPLSPIVAKRRRSKLNLSDEEYVLSAEESDSSDRSSAHSSEGSSSARRKSNRKRAEGQSSGVTRRTRKSSKAAEEDEDEEFKVKREKVPIVSKRKKLVPNKKSITPESPTLPVPLGPLLTPPPQPSYAPALLVTPISLISTPQTVIQTNSHTILVPPGTAAAASVKPETHIATVTGSQGPSPLDHTPPKTPIVFCQGGTSVVEDQVDAKSEEPSKNGWTVDG